MAGDTTHEVDSSSHRRDGDDRSSDRLRHRHGESSRRRRDEDDDEARKHSSRSSHSHSDRRREGKDRDSSRHGHRDDRHRSGHHHSSKDRHRERDEEDRSERKRRHRDEDASDSKGRRDETRSEHRRHRRDEEDSRHRSRSDKDRHTSREDSDKQPATDFIPTSESLQLTSNAADESEPPSTTQPASTLKRDDWMTGGGSDTQPDEVAYFSSFGKARVKAPRPEKPDPEKLKISSRELNTQLRQGKTVDEYETPSDASAAPSYGAPGYQWRMMKLKRTLEAAEQEGRRLEEVALERYASLADFEHAQAERRFLDGKEGGKVKGGVEGRSTPTLQSVARRSYLIASGGAGDEEGVESSRSTSGSPGVTSRPGSRQAFKRPGESSNPATPTSAPSRPPRNVGFETPSSRPTTPTAIPSVFTPVVERPTSASAPAQGVVLDDGSSDPDRPILTADQLNKLQAKIFQAELMGDPELDALRAEYDSESARAKAHQSAGDRGGAFASLSGARNAASTSAGVLVQDGERELQVLPTLDARGRMYDVGSHTSTPPPADNGKKRKLKGRADFESRDPRTGSIVRYSADDDSVTLGDLVRQEKFGAGSRWEKNPDSEVAANIMRDAHYSGDLEEQDSEAHRYASKKARSDALKRQFAINDFARTKQALDRCRFCWQDEGARPPKVTVVSSGYRAYLAVPDTEAVTARAEDHLLIVPMQHHLSLLEADDDTWDEMKNFAKCLTQLASSQDKCLVFYETLTSIKNQLHSVMEVVLLPQAAKEMVRGVFKQSLSQMGMEFSTHRKVIELSAERPFRNALVPNLPYFAVSFDYKWSSGYGHVIENSDAKGKEEEVRGDAYDVEEMANSGGGFDGNFARDVLRGVLEDLDDGQGAYERSYGKSRRRSDDEKRKIKQSFMKDWSKVDWTKMLTS